MLKQGLIGSLVSVACVLAVGTALSSDELESVEITDISGYQLVYCVPLIDSAEELAAYIGRCDERLAGVSDDEVIEAVTTLNELSGVEGIAALIDSTMEVICAYATDPNGAGESAVAVEELNSAVMDSLRITGFRVRATAARLRALRTAATVLAVDPGAVEFAQSLGRVVVEGTVFDEMRAFGVTSGAGEVQDESAATTNVVLESGNPSRGRISLSVSGSRAVPLDLRLFDTGGRLVGELHRETTNAGGSRIDWEPSGLSSGIYWLVVGIEGKDVARLKLMFLR